MNNCFSVYHTSRTTCFRVTLFETGSSEVNSAWLITSELANRRAQKALLHVACVVYTKYIYCTHELIFQYMISISSTNESLNVHDHIIIYLFGSYSCTIQFLCITISCRISLYTFVLYICTGELLLATAACQKLFQGSSLFYM